MTSRICVTLRRNNVDCFIYLLSVLNPKFKRTFSFAPPFYGWHLCSWAIRPIISAMIKIFVLEDDENDFQSLKDALACFFSTQAEEYSLIHFQDAETALFHFNPSYDLIFMDIELPNTNGLEATKKIRDVDKTVPIIFITNMQKYASEGYGFGVFDFILKPVRQGAFDMKMNRVLAYILSERKLGASVSIETKGVLHRIRYVDILYLEVRSHYLHFKTKEEEFDLYGSLQSVEEDFLTRDFLKCHRSFLVNPTSISSISNTDILLYNGETLPLSRSHRKSFMEQFAIWAGR